MKVRNILGERNARWNASRNEHLLSDVNVFVGCQFFSITLFVRVARPFDDLEQLTGSLVDSAFDARTAQNLQMKLKEGKNYVKTDFKVRTYGNIIIKCVIP